MLQALQKTYVHAKVHSWLAVTYPLQKLISANTLPFLTNRTLLCVKMFQFPNFDWLFEEWPELNIRIASAVVLTALLASISYIFLQYRKPKNAALRHRRAILHHECFNGFSTPPHINCQNGKCLCCPKAKQMALGTIVGMSGDLPSKRIIFLRRPVTTSKNNRNAPQKAGSSAKTSILTTV
ncbi:hypothetical protein T02_15599 [Trichinella nativa]|uniref:Uncharacterized protein n=1 Tax=Trichinella nativa TaxID=6335 RepID=A0A0V1KP50_9BILA|nr:hypothetical protein T02_15599 [Trichinella nativa]